LSYNDCLKEGANHKWSNHYAVSLIALTAKIVTQVLRRKFEKKIQDLLVEKINLELEEAKELQCNLDAENNTV
jgi:hypothetical protein